MSDGQAAPGGPRPRPHRIVLLAALTGAVTGLGVAGFERLVGDQLYRSVRSAPVWVQAVAPLLGLLVAAACLRWLAGGASPATTETYIRSFHERDRAFDLRPVLGRLLASIATLGGGVPLGYEGPAIYLGAAVGAVVRRRTARWLTADDAKLLLAAGAAAGVAAIFKAPATGALFAVEVPYQADLARRMLFPALIGAAVSYLTYVSLVDVSPLLRVAGSPRFDLADLGGAAVLGLAAGIGARGFVWLMHRAERVQHRWGGFRLALIGGVALGAGALLAHHVFHQPLLLGPGYEAITWAIDPSRAVGLVVVLLLLRAVATAVATGSGGVGGMFVPLTVEGALLGRLVGSALGRSGSSLFPIVGVAAFLGAGYRVPLASIMFVAESTGRPGFVVPALIAGVVAQLVMDGSSLSRWQRSRRGGVLTRQRSVPVSAAVEADVGRIGPDATVHEAFWSACGNRHRLVAVVAEGRYLGLAGLDDLLAVDRERWDDVAVRDAMRVDTPTVGLEWTVGRALDLMESIGNDALPVLDGTDFVGVLAKADVLDAEDGAH